MYVNEGVRFAWKIAWVSCFFGIGRGEEGFVSYVDGSLWLPSFWRYRQAIGADGNLIDEACSDNLLEESDLLLGRFFEFALVWF